MCKNAVQRRRVPLTIPFAQEKKKTQQQLKISTIISEI